jgi:hypothetical protein
MFAAAAALWIATAFLRELPVPLHLIAPLAERCLALLSAPNFFFFRGAFTAFATALTDVDGTQGLRLLRMGLRFWPHLTTAKQLAFLKVLALALRKLTPKQTTDLLPRLLALVADTVQSPAPRVAEAALVFLTDRAVEPFLVGNVRLLFPAVHDAVAKASASHWNSKVRELARTTAAALAKFDRRLYQQLSHEGQPERDVQSMVPWVQCLDAASQEWEDVPGKLAEIKRLFGAAVWKSHTQGNLLVRRQPSVDLRRNQFHCPVDVATPPLRASNREAAPAKPVKPIVRGRVFSIG